MEVSSLVPYDEPRFLDYYLTWYDSRNGDLGSYGDPLSSSRNESCDDSYYLIYENAEGYNPSQSWYSNGGTANDLDYREIEMPYSGGGNWFGDYFRSYLGVDEVYSDGTYGSNLEKQDSTTPYEGDKYGSFYNENDQWGGLGFEDEFPDFDDQDFPYISAWDDWEDTALYNRIFDY